MKPRAAQCRHSGSASSRRLRCLRQLWSYPLVSLTIVDGAGRAKPWRGVRFGIAYLVSLRVGRRGVSNSAVSEKTEIKSQR